MVFIECMACGTPTIGAKSGGPTEFVKPVPWWLVQRMEKRLVGERVARWWFQICFIFIPIWGNDPI